MFPLNYFKTALSPVACFVNRSYLRVWQFFVLILLHVGLLLLPISHQIGGMQTADLTQFMPKALALLNDEVITALQLGGNRLVVNHTEGIVAVGQDQVSARQLLGEQTGVVFTEDGFIIQEAGRSAIEQFDLDGHFLREAESVEALVVAMSKQWFTVNRLAIVMTVFINTWLLFSVSFIILVFGVSGFLSLMRLNPLFNIRNYKEALTISYNCLGIPSVVAAIAGYMTQDPTAVLTTQGIGFILMLILVYWKTHFNDKYVQTREV